MNSTISRIAFKKFGLGKAPFRTFAVKLFKTHNVFENGKTTSTLSDQSLQINHPIEGLLACAGTCEIGSIGYFAKLNKVPIDKIEVDVNAEYDMEHFAKKKSEPNTYKSINLEVKIFSSEQDKKKLEETVKKGMETCPVLSTIRLAGVPIKENVTYH